MKRFGPDVDKMREMEEYDIFLLRVNLLIVIVKAALKGYPINSFRKEAALDNSLLLHKQACQIDLSHLGMNNSTHIFRERVKLLCIMTTAMLTDNQPLGIHRREAMLENVEGICGFAFPKQNFDILSEILKVA